jgi:Flagellar biosynthesis pathway, component FliR
MSYYGCSAFYSVALNNFPIHSFIPSTEQFLGIAQLGGTLFLQALQLSLPLIFMLLAVNLALGLLNRMTPQFSAFVIGFPLTLMIGIFALYQSMPLLIEMFQHMRMTLGQQLILFFSAA